MPVLLGKSTALKVQQASIIAAYALLLAFVVLGLMSPWFLLSSVSLVAALAIMNYVKVNKDPAILKRANMYNRVNHLLLRSVLIVAMLLI
jgi:1,4-dihydroxy-2-naphthoate octaprenyltransferase